MKIERLELSNNKLKYIVIGVIITLLLVILINYLTTRASYRNTESIELAKGTINYSLVDLEIVSITIDGSPSDIMPGDGYALKDTSYCTEKVGDTDTPSDTIELTYENGILNITPYTTKGTNCYLEFEKYVPPTAEDMLAKLETAKGSQYSISTLSAPMTKNQEASTNKLYKYPEGSDYTYIFRGNVTDNWLNFAGHTWRIIRINSDGTLRIIFSCATEDCFTTTGPETNAVTGSAYNSSINDNTYVGYYFGTPSSSSYEETHKSLATNPSNVATAVKDWYNGTGAMSSYESKISGSTGFCNDRSLYVSSGYGNGAGNQISLYGAYGRFVDASQNGLTSVTPSLNCSSNDLFTYSKDAGKGNGILEVPAALITADEVALAGMLYDSAVTSNWLYTNEYYWTMSPYNWYGGGAHVFILTTGGSLSSFGVYWTAPGVRPVINLKANISITGAGTTDNPFVAT